MTLLSLFLAALIGLATPLLGQTTADGFDHPKHAKLFPRCESCHVGASTADSTIWPTAASCADCHDGTIERRVAWQPRVGAPASNLRYDHIRHQRAGLRAASRDSSRSPPTCASCHGTVDGKPMEVRRSQAAQCLACHRSTGDHLVQADTACGTCHVPLPEAPRLTAERVKAFPVPPGHRDPGFLLPKGHGAAAKSTGAGAVAASCSTCHAREYCIACHVNAPETPTIQALGLDARSLVHRSELKAPASHRAADFGRRHGNRLDGAVKACATCHTQASCVACHQGAGSPAIGALPAGGPGRGPGAKVLRTRPINHTADFARRHGGPATAASTSCTTCHTRDSCLECHRPGPGARPGYHPAGFLTQHPAAAYTRETSCADCHNQLQFCAACHQQSGLTAKVALGKAPFHDGKRFFIVGHGQAARQNLESCVSCHAERDCLTCHASLGGRRFSPHGPGFNPVRLKRKNPEMCTACHGTAIPDRED